MENKKFWSVMLIMALVFGMAVVGCDTGGGSDKDNENGNGTGNGGSNGQWRESKTTHYTVTDGVASLSYETVNNWIIYRHTSDTDYEEKYSYTYTQTTGSTTNTVSQTIHSTPNTITLESTSVSGTSSSTGTSSYTYDLASGLQSKATGSSTFSFTNNSGGTTTNTTTSEQSYTNQLISDSGGVKTYKHYTNSYILNGVSQDPSTQGYSEVKVQNGRKLEEKEFTAAGVLSRTTTYTLSDNAVIRAKLGGWTLHNIDELTIAYNFYSTVEVLSDSATELVVREKYFQNNVLSSYTDYTYEKVN